MVIVRWRFKPSFVDLVCRHPFRDTLPPTPWELVPFFSHTDATNLGAIIQVFNQAR